jgi:hypothetical protein
MFRDQLSAAIDAAAMPQLDQLAVTLWRAHAAGHVDDDNAQQLAERMQARREAGRQKLSQPATADGRASPMFLPRPRKQRPPHKQRAIERRRRLAASGPLPPTLACRFTTCELAVLRLIGDHVAERGLCDRTFAELAARAGTCRTVARNAIRLAARLGLLTVQERRRPGRKNLSNVIRVVAADWLLWIKRGAARRRHQEQGAEKWPPRIQGLKPASTSGLIQKRDRRGDDEISGQIWPRTGKTGVAATKHRTRPNSRQRPSS